MVHGNAASGQQFPDVPAGQAVRRYQRTATEITSGGNRNPAKDEVITRAVTEQVSCNSRWTNATVLARERGVCAPYLKNLARNWGLPVRRHSDFSGIGHLDLPAPPSPAMRAVTMRTGALGRLELITQILGHDSIAAAARALYGGRDGALQQMIRKIETAAGFPIIDRSSTPLSPTGAGREFIREANQVLQAAGEQAEAHPT